MSRMSWGAGTAIGCSAVGQAGVEFFCDIKILTHDSCQYDLNSVSFLKKSA